MRTLFLLTICTTPSVAACNSGQKPGHEAARDAAAGSGHPAAAEAGPKMLASIFELMDSLIDPSADAVWRSAGSIIDESGVHDLAPRTPEDWANVRRAGIRIIEGVNLLTMPGRHVAPPGTRSVAPGVELEPEQIEEVIEHQRATFVSFARTLQLVGSDVVRASDAKDAAALLEIGGRMEAVCESCHQTFWYPHAEPRK